MNEPELKYAVLLSQPEALNPPQVAEALSKFLKVPFQDAARTARGCWGIAGENLVKDEASRLAALLEEAKIKSSVLPQNLLEDIPDPQTMKSLEFHPSGVLANLEAGQQAVLPRESLRMIAAIGYNLTTSTTVKVKEGPSPAQRAISRGLLMAGIPLPIGGRSKEVETKKSTTELYYALDLCIREPSRRFRIFANGFNFSCLKARMGYSTPQNFRALLLELIHQCPQALKNRGSQVLLDGSAVSAMGYDTLADLDREIRWRLTLDTLQNP